MEVHEGGAGVVAKSHLAEVVHQVSHPSVLTNEGETPRDNRSESFAYS